MASVTQKMTINLWARVFNITRVRHYRASVIALNSRGYSVLPPPRDAEEKAVLDKMLRVDHAGEFGANRIYAGQMAVLGRTHLGPLIQQMWDQEKIHLRKFDEILAENRVRPTALLPLWNVAGFLLGASTALLGKEGAMACTVAVEESISEHYNSQIRALMEADPERYKDLLQLIKEFRDDEIEHHDTGLEHDAESMMWFCWPHRTVTFSSHWSSSQPSVKRLG
ncbi:5-demethoxyubiquinone hydroxylase, mitochondrial isoform X1 [Brienomyrus brachyistius]|uniref:5-demethoxyubiquinone hydroxylase, mitochondrial isoform X1 n=1 Tax=Brienomyrus brachyistius TaxID=42636 RepID=UPI0020B1E228|nr:5-demethoxyubiquinone hydroxylase, mitochondrial isoform X1 [Brienomyrus brachyistius]